MTVFLFFIGIFGMAAASLGKPPAGFSEIENRVLAQKPKMSIETIGNGEFQGDYEAYLTDQFPLRDRWIGLKTSMERLLLKRESKDIYFGEDGYLLEKHTDSYTTRTAKRNLMALAEFTGKYEEELGPGHVSVLLIPDAVDILQDKLPPFASAGQGMDYLEQACKALPQGTCFDAASILRAHKEEELYYRTDHHWKTLAAFYVHQAWARERGYGFQTLEDYEIQTVTDSFQGTIQSKLGIQTAGDTIELFLPKKEIPYVVEKNDSTEESLYDYGALDTKDQYAVFFGGNEPFLRIRTEADQKRRILVIKDSYANCFLPFMLGEFQEIDVLDLRYTNEPLEERIQEGGYTDILILYHVSGFAEDMSIVKITN